MPPSSLSLLSQLPSGLKLCYARNKAFVRIILFGLGGTMEETAESGKALSRDNVAAAEFNFSNAFRD
jgi:hypothetical protein